MIPAWLARAIADRDGAPIGARTARPNLCTKCTTWTLLGLDADTLATTARVDPTPLTATGELVALLTHRPTWTLTRTGQRLLLDDRDPWRTRGRPPGNPTAPYTVVPAHRCHQPLTGHLVTTWPTALQPTSERAPDLEHIPY